MAKEPMYPHVPKKKEPLFPHMPQTAMPSGGSEAAPNDTILEVICMYCGRRMPDRPGYGTTGTSAGFCEVCWAERYPGEPYPTEEEARAPDLLASTEDGPISKYCCSICDDCAPEELLEEGRFLDRITWLRGHYNQKHPGKWGGMSPMTILVGELVKPEHRHLLDMVNEPLPPEAY